MSDSIERPAAPGVAPGGRLNAAGRAAEPGIYEMARPTPRDVREAGERDASPA